MVAPIKENHSVWLCLTIDKKKHRRTQVGLRLLIGEQYEKLVYDGLCHFGMEINEGEITLRVSAKYWMSKPEQNFSILEENNGYTSFYDIYIRIQDLILSFWKAANSTG